MAGEEQGVYTTVAEPELKVGGLRDYPGVEVVILCAPRVEDAEVDPGSTLETPVLRVLGVLPTRQDLQRCVR